MIHGYGGGCFTYFKIPQYLKEFYRIIILDIPGMGLNSRNQFIETFETHEEWINYYKSRLNSFFVKLKLEKFILVGHSIGAYIATNYFGSYSEKVQKLILVSPAGFNLANDEYMKKVEKLISKYPWYVRWTVGCIAKKIFQDKISPFSYAFFTSTLLDKYLTNPRFKFTEVEKKQIKIIMTYFINAK